jgi:hypothetical protein
MLHDELRLVNKSAYWVPKLLNRNQKKGRVRIGTDFVEIINQCSMLMLDNIVPMDVMIHTV